MSLQNQLQQALGSAYTVTSELGGGGMSRVFVAREAALDRDVAVKVLPAELSAGVNLDRFRREILLAAQLQHPNIVPVLSAGEMEGLPYYTMPFVRGESLRTRLARGPLDVPETVGILREVARALAYAHERGVVHRDIKPDNVLISGGSAVVTDFGIAKALLGARVEGRASSDPISTPDPRRSALTAMGTSIGTPAYMAPEQAAGDPATDHRADIYALGCMAFEMLTGRPPFVATSPHRLLTAHMTEAPPTVVELRPDVPVPLSELVARMLEKDPAVRPQSANEIIHVLDGVTSSAGQASMPPMLLGAPGMFRNALLMYAVAFVVVAIVAKAAIVGVGLPDWVFPGALVVMALGLPVVLFTGYAHYAARRVLASTPKYTPGGTPAPHGTMATLALRASPHLSWRRTLWGGAAAVGAFVLVIGGYMLLRAMGIGPAGSLLASGRLNARDKLVIADFRAAGPDSSLGTVIEEAVRADLGQSDVVTILPQPAVAAALVRTRRPPTTRIDVPIAREIALREGAKAVVDGDIAPLGSGYIVSLRLVSADSGVILAAFRATADGPKDLLPMLGRLTHDLRGKMGESLRTVHASPPLEQLTTASLEALRLYVAGQHANNVDANFDKAIELDREALALDSTFASAWRGLGVSLRNAGHPAAEWQAATRNAYRYRDRLPDRERLLATAEYWYGPGQDRAKAAGAYEELLARNPGEYIATNNLGVIEATRRNSARADTLFRAAYALSQGAAALGGLVRAEYNLGHVAVADSLTRVALRQPGASSLVRILPAFGLYARGRLDSLGEYLQTIRNAPSGRVRTFTLSMLSSLALLRGHVDDGLRIAAENYEVSRVDHLSASPLDLALAEARAMVWFREQPSRAVAILDSALRQHPLKDLEYDDRHYFDLAAAYALAGRPDRARAMLAAFDGDVRDTTLRRASEPARHGALAEIAIAERRPRDAVDEIRRSDQLPDGPANPCGPCQDAQLGRVFDLAGMPDSAITMMQRYVETPYWDRLTFDGLYLAGTYKRLGELYEAKGDAQNAAAYYTKFLELWKHPDPPLQPKVDEVKRRLAHLVAGSEKPPLTAQTRR